MANLYRPGDHYVCCDRCGREIRRSQARKTWDNLMVCAKDWEPRHPQDFVRAKTDRQAVRDPRPEPDDVFVTTNQITADDL